MAKSSSFGTTAFEIPHPRLPSSRHSTRGKTTHQERLARHAAMRRALVSVAKIHSTAHRSLSDCSGDVRQKKPRQKKTPSFLRQTAPKRTRQEHLPQHRKRENHARGANHSLTHSLTKIFSKPPCPWAETRTPVACGLVWGRLSLSLRGTQLMCKLCRVFNGMKRRAGEKRPALLWTNKPPQAPSALTQLALRCRWE